MGWWACCRGVPRQNYPKFLFQATQFEHPGWASDSTGKMKKFSGLQLQYRVMRKESQHLPMFQQLSC